MAGSSEILKKEDSLEKRKNAVSLERVKNGWSREILKISRVCFGGSVEWVKMAETGQYIVLMRLRECRG